MKVWLHIIAAVVGLVLAALIVYLVFGNASQKGATQDGEAPTVTASGGTSLCGSISPDQVRSPATVKDAAKAENLPDVISPTGATLNIAKADQPWFARLQAAGGFCVDQVELPDGVARVAMSTTDDVTAQEASAFTAGVIAAAFTAPFDRPIVQVETFVGEQRRTVLISRRAWQQFTSQGRRMGLGRSMADLAKFRRSTAFSDRDLKVGGWS